MDPAKANRILTAMMAPLKELGAPPVLMESYVSRQEYENLQKVSAEPPWDGGMTWSALMDSAKEMAGVSTAPRSSGAGDPERLRNTVNTAYHAMYHALCRSNADAICTKSQHPLSELTWTITYMAVGHRQARKRLAENGTRTLATGAPVRCGFHADADPPGGRRQRSPGQALQGQRHYAGEQGRDSHRGIPRNRPGRAPCDWALS